MDRRDDGTDRETRDEFEEALSSLSWHGPAPVKVWASAVDEGAQSEPLEMADIEFIAPRSTTAPPPPRVRAFRVHKNEALRAALRAALRHDTTSRPATEAPAPAGDLLDAYVEAIAQAAPSDSSNDRIDFDEVSESQSHTATPIPPPSMPSERPMVIPAHEVRFDVGRYALSAAALTLLCFVGLNIASESTSGGHESIEAAAVNAAPPPTETPTSAEEKAGLPSVDRRVGPVADGRLPTFVQHTVGALAEQRRVGAARASSTAGVSEEEPAVVRRPVYPALAEPAVRVTGLPDEGAGLRVTTSEAEPAFEVPEEVPGQEATDVNPRMVYAAAVERAADAVAGRATPVALRPSAEAALHDLLDRAVPALAIAVAPSPVELARTRPDRREVQAAFRAILPEIRSCSDQTGAIVNLRVTFTPRGTVASALVHGRFAGTREGSCMARVARRVGVAAFDGDRIVVNMPLRL